MEETDVILLWGSNARETHPIFFHHVLKAIHRGAKVYVDYLQNIEGKTLASAYSARASDYAGVSTPLSWTEVEEGVQREDFTIRTMAARLRTVGDLWEPIRSSPGADLHELVRRSQRSRRR